jgi:hypothetical protein
VRRFPISIQDSPDNSGYSRIDPVSRFMTDSDTRQDFFTCSLAVPFTVFVPCLQLALRKVYFLFPPYEKGNTRVNALITHCQSHLVQLVQSSV